MRIKIFLLLALLLSCQFAQADRVKDLTSIAGVRNNQLVGFGLVVGLPGTGDKTKFTGQSLRNMLVEMGVNLPVGLDPKSKNIAAVSVHADLPPFAKPGQSIDVNVSSIGDSKSLKGGSLLMTPLKGADGRIYAMAQGNLLVGGIAAGGDDGTSVTVNTPSGGTIPNGATVERTVKNAFNVGDHIILDLHSPDFTTASRLTNAINHTLGKGTARAMDADSVSVSAPRDPSQRVPFLALIENLEVSPGDGPAKVIINSRNGTVVIGQFVRVSPAAVTHGNMSVTITNTQDVSQPGAFSNGQTTTTNNTSVGVTEEKNKMFVFAPGVSLDAIVQAINRLGASPSDVVAILEALKRAGALRAEIEVI